MLKIFMFMFILIHTFFFFNWSLLTLNLILGYIMMFFLKILIVPFYLNNLFLMDKMVFLLLILTFLIFCLSILSSNCFVFLYNYKLYLFNLMFLLIMLILTFLINKLIFFFFFFESTLIPTFYLILGWGMKIERIQSGMYMLFYTLFGSLPMLLGFMTIYKMNFSFSFFLIEIYSENLFFFLCFFLAFLMKIPMFLFHSWLPKAHVEAPVSGSMILAGVLLKLGGYGIIRFLSIFLMMKKMFMNIFFIISLLGGLISGIICLRQTDLKSLVAYSSVSHMSLIVCSVFTLSKWGILGSIMMMISHGFCSSALFVLVNFNYERIYSRSMILNKGFIIFLPSLTFWWFMFCACNMACPPTLNLISEIFMFSSIFSWTFLSNFYLLLMPFVSAVYNLNMFSFTQHGLSNKNFLYIYPCEVREYLILILHIFPLFLMFLKMEMMVF